MKRCSQYAAETILFIINNLLDLESLNISGVLTILICVIKNITNYLSNQNMVLIV